MHRLLAACFCVAAASITYGQVAPPPEMPPSEELLSGLQGDSEARLKVMRYCGWKLWDEPERFYPAMVACMEDPDVEVRRTVVTLIGEFMVWRRGPDEPQSQNAIAFLQKHSYDADERTRYNCVYYGLSTVRQKSDELVDRLLDLMIQATNPEDRNLESRVKWGLSHNPQQAAHRIQAKIAGLNDKGDVEAKMLAELHFKLTGQFPEGLERFGGDGLAMFSLGANPAFIPRSAEHLDQTIRKTCGTEIPIEKLHVSMVRGDYQAVLLVTGFHHYANLVGRLKNSDQLTVHFHHDLSRLKADDRHRMLNMIEKHINEPKGNPDKPYEQAFYELYDQIGKDYAHFKLKGIDWKAVGEEFLPRSKEIDTRSQFCLLCQQLVAKLEDSHAYLFKGKHTPVSIPMPSWDPGFACLMGDQGKPIVYYVDHGSPAMTSGVKVGMTVVTIDETPVDAFMKTQMDFIKKYAGYSSDRYLRYHAAQWIGRNIKRDSEVTVVFQDVDGDQTTHVMKSTLKSRYLPRLPVPIEGINDSANVSWKQIDKNLGYIYVRRIRADLNEQLDAAVTELGDCDGLVIDVRGNSGGGFDAQESFRNFELEKETNDSSNPRPRFEKPIAVLIDARCISAGEGWISWFRANQRATFFGETTAGASGRKKTIKVLDGAYQVIYSVKAYKGFLDRPIERKGITPDVVVRQSAKDLVTGTDTVLEAAIKYLKITTNGSPIER